MALVANCSITVVIPITAVPYLPSTNITLLPALDPAFIESYYRASSFALFSFYTDTTANQTELALSRVNFTALVAAPVLYDSATINATFLACVNDTISNVLPIEAGSFAMVRPLRWVSSPFC